MDNDSGALILLIVLIVFVFLLIVIKLAQFVNHFSHEKQYLLTEMNRAADYREYRYWHRKLRCLYLCLIPFVNKRNVRKVYPVFFRRKKHSANGKRSDGLVHILGPSMLAICICAVCLCGASWAWFTASTSTGITAIQSSSYKLQYRVGEDTSAAEISEVKTLTVPGSGSCKITLSAEGTTGATGYCSIKVGEKTYYTGQIFVDDTTFTFTVNAAEGTEITLTPKWGTYSGAADISDNGSIGTPSNSLPVKENDRSENSSEAVDETSAADTEAASDSSSTESKTAAPAPSEAAKTAAQSETSDKESTSASETADTESTSASETSDTEDTTAAQTEPPSAGESENN